MATTGERIDLARKRRGWTKTRLAKAIGIKQQSISDLIAGEFPGTSRLDEIAAVLDVSVEWLTTGHPAQPWEYALAGPGTNRVREGGERITVVHRSAGSVLLELPAPAPDADRPPFTPSHARELPMVGAVAAGDGFISFEAAPRAFALRPGWVVMRVEGSSAYPVVYPNQFVVVDLDRPVRHNNLVILQTDDGKAYLKRYCEDPRAPDGFILASVNAGIDSPFIPRSAILVMRPVVGVLFEE